MRDEHLTPAPPPGPGPLPAVLPVESPPPAPAPRGPRWLPNLLLLLLLSLTAALAGGLLVALGNFRAAGLLSGLALLAALVLALRPLFVRGARRFLRTLAFVAILCGFLFASALLSYALFFHVFHVPTGSMALGIQGAHREVTCPECGYRFTVNASMELDHFRGLRTTGCTCQNCLRHIALAHPAGGGEAPRGAITPSELASGDRILVARYLTGPGADLQRNTVVAFWYPKTAEMPPQAPAPPEEFRHEPVEDTAPRIYLGRVVGLPGETLAIAYGRLYRAQVPVSHPEDRQVDPRELWKPAHFHSQTLDFREAKGRELWKQLRFEILRKDPQTLLALRRPVHDNDHQAADLKGVLPPRWAGPAWAADGTGFRSDPAGAEVSWLRYRHILRPQDWPERSDPEHAGKVEEIKRRAHKPQLITDFLAYNSPEREGARAAPLREGNWVGDLMLECRLKVEKGGGEFWLELSKGVDRFRARFDLTTGKCTLSRLGSDGKLQELQSAPTRVSGPGEHRLRLANVDERLTLWVDEELPFGDGVAYEPPPEKGPTANDLEPASVGARGAAVQVHRLQLWRDTYHTLQAGLADAAVGHGEVDDFDPRTWGPLRRLKYRTFYVQPGHYLCLGDNSPQSSDSRDWGTVPERLLIGRALLTYAPLDRLGLIH
jgi:signal peptidase I